MPHNGVLYKRYIDDGFGASSRSESVLDFNYFVQIFHPSVKFTYNISVEFLDIQANIKHGKFNTSVFYSHWYSLLPAFLLITLTQKQAFRTLSSSNYEDFDHKDFLLQM